MVKKETVIILIQAGCGLGRTHLEKIEGESFEDVKSLLDRIDPKAESLFFDNQIQIWKMTDFMDAWNNTDDDQTMLEIGDSFIGHVKLKYT